MTTAAPPRWTPRPRPANRLRELRRERKELTMARNKAATVPTPNEATHTPGPWKATNTGWGHSVIHPPDCPRDSDDYVIAYVPRGGVLNTADVGRANATLIAKAPQLHESIREFLGWADAGRGDARPEWVDAAIADFRRCIEGINA